MAQQQWISPAYQPAPTFIAHCVALKAGFSMAWQGSNQQTMPQIWKKKSTYLFAPFSHLKYIAYKLPHTKFVPSPLRAQDYSGLFLMCLLCESPVRTNKPIIFTTNMIILINVMHTRGFDQLEMHISLYIMLFFEIATLICFY